MTIWIAWLVFPLVLGVLSLGCGLLAERAAGVEIPSPLLLLLGFAVVALTGPVRDRRRAHGAARDSARRCARGRRGRALPSLAAPDRRMVGRGGGRRLRRLRRAVRPLGARDVRRVHQARRHRDVSRDARSRDAARLPDGRAPAVNVRGDAVNEPRLRLPTRLVAPARRGQGARLAGRRVAVAAVSRVPGGAAGLRPLPDGRRRRCLAEAARAGRLRRRAGCAALRLRALGRSQGARDRRHRRARRRARPAHSPWRP